jgi:hypothetical protein
MTNIGGGLRFVPVFLSSRLQNPSENEEPRSKLFPRIRSAGYRTPHIGFRCGAVYPGASSEVFLNPDKMWR